MKIRLLAILSAVLLTGCNQDRSVTGEVRTDKGPIISRLPKLGQVEAVWWTVTNLTKDSFLSPPAHPIYRICGFAQLGESEAKTISEHYVWVKMPADWKPDLMITNINKNSIEWNGCDLFTRDFMPPLIGGQLAFERHLGIIYFDMGVEK